ncbi:MAG: hypothetical protein CSA81_04820 [Acidobacteria bacterium]|nr:MAG: hypothetical protein CSA81_04820 [Acidobacteriota bacterium]PIE91088.1 MAG: hypothetical protein CR997_02920 [Acidobacteriota bacterium]
MAASRSNKHTPLMSPAQTIVAFIFTNILFLILGIAIGKGDFSSHEELVTTTVEEEAVQPETNDSMDEFNSLESTSERDKKKHIDLSLPKKTTKKESTNPAPTQQEIKEEKAVAQATEPVTPKAEKPVKKKPSKKEPTAPAQNQGSFYLQIVASKDKAKAHEFSETVKKKGYPVQVIEEAGYYKIFVGPYSTREKAQRMKPDIDRVLKVQSWIKERK